MLIEDDRPDTAAYTEFSLLKPGECFRFRFGRKAYMRVEGETWTSGGSAFCPHSGKLLRVEGDVEVVPLWAVLTIKGDA